MQARTRNWSLYQLAGTGHKMMLSLTDLHFLESMKSEVAMVDSDLF